MRPSCKAKEALRSRKAGEKEEVLVAVEDDEEVVAGDVAAEGGEAAAEETGEEAGEDRAAEWRSARRLCMKELRRRRWLHLFLHVAKAPHQR